MNPERPDMQERSMMSTFDPDTLLLWVQRLAATTGITITAENVQQLGPNDREVSNGYVQQSPGQSTTCRLMQIAVFPSTTWEAPAPAIAQPAKDRTDWVGLAPQRPTFYHFTSTTEVDGYEPQTTHSAVVVMPYQPPQHSTPPANAAEQSVHQRLAELGIDKTHGGQLIERASVHFVLTALELADRVAKEGADHIDQALHRLRTIQRRGSARAKRQRLQEEFGYICTAEDVGEINLIIAGALCRVNFLRSRRRL